MLVAMHIMTASAAAGPIGLAIGAAVLAIGALSGQIAHLINGCGDACTQATAIVNEAEGYVRQIASQYWKTPVRTVAFQKWTLGQLDSIFAQVEQLCGKIPGDPGKRCVQERLTRGFVPPWCRDNGLAVGVNDVVGRNSENIFGRCGGWYDVTYDPIAQDPNVQPDAVEPTLSAAADTLKVFSSVVPGGYGTMFVAGLGVLALIGYKVRNG